MTPSELPRQPTFALGRPYSVAEVIVIARRATFDPGAFCKRRTDHNGPEELHRWQARAVAVALGPNGPAYEHKWSNLAQAVRNMEPGEVYAVEEVTERAAA
jgi:hypothetical protein